MLYSGNDALIESMQVFSKLKHKDMTFINMLHQLCRIKVKSICIIYGYNYKIHKTQQYIKG